MRQFVFCEAIEGRGEEGEEGGAREGRPEEEIHEVKARVFRHGISVCMIICWGISVAYGMLVRKCSYVDG